MITYAWRTELEAAELDEVRALVNEAAAYDDEAGFSQLSVDSDERTTDGLRAARVFHLVVRIRPDEREDADDAPWPVAAYLRVRVSEDHLGTVQLVVRPAYRSLGVATLLFEQLGRDGSEGWAATSAAALQAWAHGDHPAAYRMSLRFGAERLRELWRLIKPLHEQERSAEELTTEERINVRPCNGTEDAASIRRIEQAGSRPVDVPPAGSPCGGGFDARHDTLIAVDGAQRVVGVIRLHTADADGSPIGTVGTILHPFTDRTADYSEVSRTLLIGGLRRLRDAGMSTAELHIDSADSTTVALTRQLGFQHDQSDACYRVELGLSPTLDAQ